MTCASRTVKAWFAATEAQQQERLSMDWCLDCHRHPDPHLRDPAMVTNLGWTFEGTEEQREAEQARWRAFNAINPSQDCSTCHR